tara:strand:- start:76 stop:813 length:738 start_codon:yes stop_codon:yes gene_type:complete
MKNIKTYEEFINEEIPTVEINPDKFPEHGSPKDKKFWSKGKLDGNTYDDIVQTKDVKIPAKSLNPSQSAIYLGKALGLAIGGVSGGDLQAVISADNRILDGHHRWAATMFNNPKDKVGGVKAELKIGDLIPVLRQAGDVLGNKRGIEPAGGDVNIFKATIEDVISAIYDGDNMDKEYYNKEKSINWFERIGKDIISSRLMTIQSKLPPDGAPPRKEMPKIEPKQVNKIAKHLAGGKIDIRDPYTK